jgi:hypothetical protein
VQAKRHTFGMSMDPGHYAVKLCDFEDVNTVRVAICPNHDDRSPACNGSRMCCDHVKISSLES